MPMRIQKRGRVIVCDLVARYGPRHQLLAQEVKRRVHGAISYQFQPGNIVCCGTASRCKRIDVTRAGRVF